eukprot:g23878.t1
MLLRGGNFTISEVKEVVDGCFLVAEVMYTNAPLSLMNVYIPAVNSEQLTILHLFLVLRRIGLALLPWNTPSSCTVLYHLSFVEKFVKKNTIDHKSIRKWSACSVLKTLWEKERVDLANGRPAAARTTAGLVKA